jgi:hypothetical protein
MKGADNACIQMAPYLIRHLIIQSYAIELILVGFNIVTNVPGCVLIKICQNFLNKVRFFKNSHFNIKSKEQPPVEVLLIESEITMRCIRKDAIEVQFDSDQYYQFHNTCTTINAKNGRMEIQYGSLFVRTFNYLVGSTSPGTIIHLTGIHQSYMDEFGYAQHSFKKEFKFPKTWCWKKNTKRKVIFMNTTSSSYSAIASSASTTNGRA